MVILQRNKVSERSILLLKKQHDSDVPVSSNIKYKVLDIKNNAPTFIKTLLFQPIPAKPRG